MLWGHVEAEGGGLPGIGLDVLDLHEDAVRDGCEGDLWRGVLHNARLPEHLRPDQRRQLRLVEWLPDIGRQSGPVIRLPDIIARVGEQPPQYALLALQHA